MGWFVPGCLRDKDGKLMKADDFIRRERKEWFRTFATAVKECAGTGKTFIKENAAFAEKQLKGK